MTFDLIVNSRKETRESGLELELTATEPVGYGGIWFLRGTMHPDVSNLRVGQRVRVTLEDVPESLPVTSAEAQEFIDTGTFRPAAPIDVEVARMHDEGNPNDHEAVF